MDSELKAWSKKQDIPDANGYRPFWLFYLTPYLRNMLIRLCLHGLL